VHHTPVQYLPALLIREARQREKHQRLSGHLAWILQECIIVFHITPPHGQQIVHLPAYTQSHIHTNSRTHNFLPLSNPNCIDFPAPHASGFLTRPTHPPPSNCRTLWYNTKSIGQQTKRLFCQKPNSHTTLLARNTTRQTPNTPKKSCQQLLVKKCHGARLTRHHLPTVLATCAQSRALITSNLPWPHCSHTHCTPGALPSHVLASST